MDLSGWEELYRSGERGWEAEATALVVEMAQKLAPGAAIDLACGTGRNALYLAERGWAVTAIDGSATAMTLLRERAAGLALPVKTEIADLTAPDFELAADAWDLILMAYYLQRDLIVKAKNAVRPGGVVAAIVHMPEPGEPVSEKRAAPGELRGFFKDWKILWDYEGPSRDKAHRRPVAEIAARRPGSNR